MIKTHIQTHQWRSQILEFRSFLFPSSLILPPSPSFIYLSKMKLKKKDQKKIKRKRDTQIGEKERTRERG